MSRTPGSAGRTRTSPTASTSGRNRPYRPPTDTLHPWRNWPTERRLSSLESRLEDVATDAAAARYLADLGVKVDANRRAINALGEQTAGRFDNLESRFVTLENKVDAGFAAMRSTIDQTAAGHEQIVRLLDHVIAGMDDG